MHVTNRNFFRAEANLNRSESTTLCASGKPVHKFYMDHIVLSHWLKIVSLLKKYYPYFSALTSLKIKIRSKALSSCGCLPAGPLDLPLQASWATTPLPQPSRLSSCSGHCPGSWGGRWAVGRDLASLREGLAIHGLLRGHPGRLHREHDAGDRARSSPSHPADAVIP